MQLSFSFTQIVSSFVVLFALIDILGSVPLFLSLKSDKRRINPLQASVYSFVIMVLFLFLGEIILRLFNVDVSSFAVAGSLVIFIISIEMIFGVEIFRNDSPGGKSTLVPIVFPLIAGPGTFTALLSMRAEYQVENIIVALLVNMIFAYIVLRYLDVVRRLIGAEGVYVMRKFFGIILMAISVKLFTVNISSLIQ
jgi:multiple antibiotic resistance protein